MKQRKIYLPLLIGALLLGAYFELLRTRPIALGQSSDIRQLLLGPHFVYLLFAAVIALIIAGVRILDALLFDVLFSRRKNIQAPLVLREILSFVLYIVLFSSAVSWILHYSIRGLLATTTVVAAVIGLAMQETLGNLFSGISLHMERTFDVGDVVKSGEMIGVVERVGWRATRLRTFQNHIAILPNSLLSKERLEVHPQSEPNANLVFFSAAYDVEPQRALDVLQRTAAAVDGVSTRIPPIARIRAFADSSVNYEVKYWTESYHLRDSIDAEIRRVGWYALRREGIEIPYPQRVIHYAERPEAAASSDDVTNRLRAVDLFDKMTEREHDVIAQRTQRRHFGRGELILRTGEDGDSMFVVHRGEVSVRLRDGANIRPIAQLSEGSVFGEMALLTGEARTADVVAATDVIVLEIHKDALQPVLSDNPALASSLSEHIVERRQHLESSRGAAAASEESSLASRIRAWFGLR